MKLNIVYQYLLSVVIILFCFIFFAWNRTERILKDYIVDQTLVSLHEKSITKLKEVETKIKFYQNSGLEIYRKLMKQREVTEIDLVNSEIVGADLFIEKDGKFRVHSNYSRKEFLESRKLPEDFFKEIVGASPFQFALLQYSKTIVQKLSSHSRDVELLAVGMNLKNIDGFTRSPYYLILYVDLNYFNSIFPFKETLYQLMFEQVGGKVAGFNHFSEKDLFHYPPYKKFLEQNKSILNSFYIAPETGEKIFYSSVKSPSNFYITSEMREIDIFKPINILKSALSVILGALVATIGLVFVMLSFFTNEKYQNIIKQLDFYLMSRKYIKPLPVALFRDEFDEVSGHLYRTLTESEKMLQREVLCSRFQDAEVSDRIRQQQLNLDNSKTKAFVANIYFETVYDNESLEIGQNIFEERKRIFDHINEIIKLNNGIILHYNSDFLMFGLGLFSDNEEYILSGLKCCELIREYVQLENQSKKFFNKFTICVSYGEMALSSHNYLGMLDLILVGSPIVQIKAMKSLETNQDFDLACSREVYKKAEYLYEFDEVSVTEHGPDIQDLAEVCRNEYKNDGRFYLLVSHKRT